MKKALLLLVGLAVLPAAQACSTDWDITLETFGEGVTVELRSGVPGKSNVGTMRKSNGGQVGFHKLCAGKCFLAIGNEEEVRAVGWGEERTPTLPSTERPFVGVRKGRRLG